MWQDTITLDARHDLVPTGSAAAAPSRAKVEFPLVPARNVSQSRTRITQTRTGYLIIIRRLRVYFRTQSSHQAKNAAATPIE